MIKSIYLEIGRISCIIQVGPIKSHESLKVEEEGRRVDHKDAALRRIFLDVAGLGGLESQEMWASSRSCKIPTADNPKGKWEPCGLECPRNRFPSSASGKLHSFVSTLVLA